MDTESLVVRIRIKDRRVWADFKREAFLQRKPVEDLAAGTIAEYVSKRRKLEEAIHSKQGKTGLEEGSPSRVVKATSRRVDAE